ncbi:MFS transporter [Streptomyces sp. NPDC002514]|uniref:MFS transporter n=1 Tax=Streptomyces sp. NPDC001270 TaxID=3364554 RepID=UPI0036B91270
MRLYQQRDHFSTIMLTVIYALYAVGVIVSLFLGGHLSDWVGRKRVLVPALLLNAACALINLGGIGFGPLVAGVLAQYAPRPLVLPYVVFLCALIVLAVLVAFSPETADLPDPAPQYRPQRIAVPAHARGLFFAATATGLAAFAVFGIFNSLAPSFLAGALHEDSHAVAVAVAFAAFAAGAAAQMVLSRAGLALTLRTGTLVLIPGLALLAAGMWLPSLAMFVIGGVLTGGGGGLAFRGALTAAGAAAPAESRAEALAFFFLGAYTGLSVPVVGLGIATQYVSTRVVMLVFVVLVGAAAALRPHGACPVRPRMRAGQAGRGSAPVCRKRPEPRCSGGPFPVQMGRRITDAR